MKKLVQHSDREETLRSLQGAFGNLRADRFYQLERIVSGWYQLSSPAETPDEWLARMEAEEASGRRADRDWKRQQPLWASIQKGNKRRSAGIHWKTGKEIMQSPGRWYIEIRDTRLEGEAALVGWLDWYPTLQSAIDASIWELNYRTPPYQEWQ